MVLLVPALTVLLLVSSQTEFNTHLRYVFPSLALTLIFIGQSGIRLGHRFSFRSLLVIGSLASAVASTLLSYPHHLAYFNEFAGGPKDGHKHLAGSSIDWGQDVLLLREYLRNHTTINHIGLHLKSNSSVVELFLPKNPVKSQRDGSERYDLWSIERYVAEFGSIDFDNQPGHTRIGFSMLMVSSPSTH